MGCVTSQDASDFESNERSKPAPPSRPKSSKPVAKAEASKVYETLAVASLTSGGSDKPAFHGLLTGRSRPLLQYEQALRDAPSVCGVCHPQDDSLAPPLGYDPNTGVLAVSDVVMSLRYTVIVKDIPDREGYIRKIVHDVFDLIHNVANGWSETSEITEINNLKPEKRKEVSKPLARIFDIVDQLYDVTDGRFDPTSGVLKLAFLEALTEHGRPPLPQEINRFRFAMGWQKKVLRKGDVLTKVNANTIIDLDGVTKGYCIDLIAKTLQRSGYSDFYVDWAGDIRTGGRHPSGRPWRTAVMTPPPLPRLFEHWKAQTLDKVLTEHDIAYMVDLEPDADAAQGGIAMATSGDYFQIQKFGFHHIMRSKDLAAMKATMLSTGAISVLATSCALADGLATAAMTCEGPDEAASFLKRVSERMPGAVLGYAVLGRGGADDESGGTDTDANGEAVPRKTAHFKPTVSAGQNANGSRGSSVGAPTLPRYGGPWQAPTGDATTALQGVIVRVPARITWSAGFIDIDALTPCSMTPDAKVSFVVPGALSDTTAAFASVAVVRDAASETLRFAYQGGDTGSVAPVFNSVQFTLHVESVYRHGGIALVIATVSQAFQGEEETVSVAIGSGQPHSISLLHSVMRDDFLYRPVVEQAKEAFSEVPSNVSVIATESADGSQFALTATSLAVSDHAPRLFSFNIMHSSTFFAAFGGFRSRVTVYLLAHEHETLAKTFATNSLIEPYTARALAESSLCILTGEVQLMEEVEDHAIVLAEISSCAFTAEPLAPLLWHRRRYCTLEV